MPRELVDSGKHYRREMRGVAVRHDVYVSVAGTDLVRLPDGSFAVLEDNLRVPQVGGDQPPVSDRAPAGRRRIRTGRPARTSS